MWNVWNNIQSNISNGTRGTQKITLLEFLLVHMEHRCAPTREVDSISCLIPSSRMNENFFINSSVWLVKFLHPIFTQYVYVTVSSWLHHDRRYQSTLSRKSTTLLSANDAIGITRYLSSCDASATYSAFWSSSCVKIWNIETSDNSRTPSYEKKKRKV